MCGFAGVVTWDERYRVSPDTLARMSARIAHRGPDGEGTWFSSDGPITADRPQVALAHRRLAVIDPDPRGNQPFTDGEGRWLVYNGEIYNYRELRQELTRLRPEYVWRTDCDTEVLLVAYGVWGERCVEHFNGMFAFAVWDGPKNSLFLARDRMGQKPLYCASVDGTVAFASELAPLRHVLWVDTAIDPTFLSSYLRSGYIDTPQTPYRAIWKFASGCARSCRFALDMPEESYFDPNETENAAADPIRPATASGVRRRVLEAVTRQLVSDVPLGCFLSGGVDSSVIAAAMKGSVPDGQPVLTFSIGFDDPRYDETRYAERVAAHLGTTHHQFTVRPRAADDLPKLAAVFGEPFADSSALPTHYLARETRSRVKVALSGDGGDELFGGYDRYRALKLAERIDRLPTAVGSTLAGRLWQALPGTHPKGRLARVKRLLRTLHLPPGERYAAYVSLFDDKQLNGLLGDAGAPLDRAAGGQVARVFDALRYSGRDSVQAALAVDRVTYLPSDLLTKVDRASMLHALEVRSPFMDHELVQFAAGLSTDQLLRGGPKRMLREAFAADLPAWVFKRKKMGFAVPIGEWFRGELRPMLHDHLFARDSFASGHFNLPVVRRLVEEHETFRQDHSQRLYALLMLELWWRLQ